MSGLTKSFRRPERRPGVAGAVRHLVQPQYRTLTAVDDVSFSIGAGESVAYVGPNGAGKSTTVKLLTGILVPTAGTVTVCGLEPYRDRTANARNISVVFGQRTQLWWDIAVGESFQLLRRIYEVSEADYQRRLRELDDVLELEQLMSVPARQLSLGQRMRCDLAAALLHRPQVLFLDEPTIGLDVSVKARFRELIKRLHAEQGLTIMLTSHDLGDIEELCERMMMIDQGTIIYDGSLQELQHRFGWQKHLLITVDAPDVDTTRIARALDSFGVRVEEHDASVASVQFDSRTTRSGELIRALPPELAITEVAVLEISTESIVRRLYEGELDIVDDQ